MVPPTVKLSFYLGAMVFFGAVLWTIMSTKEYSVEELKMFSEQDETDTDCTKI